MFLLRLVWVFVHALFAERADLVAEDLALRQQLIVLHRKTDQSASHCVNLTMPGRGLATTGHSGYMARAQTPGIAIRERRFDSTEEGS